MNTAIRLSALLVAVAGLAATALSPSTTHAQPKHVPLAVSSLGLSAPGPLPYPPPR